jgi:hypothetical protein
MTFLATNAKAQWPKAKIRQWDYLILESFCIAKETIDKLNSQETKWKKTSGNNISDKECSKYKRNPGNPTANDEMK